MSRHVYIAMERGEGGMCKIGHSSDPEHRVKSIANSSGIDIDLAYVSKPIPHSFRVEQIAHAILKEYRKTREYLINCNTEWFHVSFDEARKAVVEAIQLVEAVTRLRDIGMDSWKLPRD